MSDQAATYRKFRDANDPAGNLGWSSKMARQAVKAGASAAGDLEEAFALSDEERVLWRLLKLPRKYMDVENAGVLPAEATRSFLRALAAADVLDVVEAGEAKPIVPIEVKRLQTALSGQEVKKARGGSALKARVYRPDISATPAPAAEPAASSSSSAAAASPPPKPEEKPAPKPAPVTLPPAPAPSVDAKALIDDIARRHKQMGKQNHYEFLEVQPTAPRDGVKAAYMRLAKTLHPDHIAGTVHDETAAKQADALFKRLQDAWSTLNDPAKRSQYDKNLGHDPTHGNSVGGKIRRTDEARIATLKADHLVKTKHFKDAESQYKSALLMDDEHGPALLGLAWAIFLNDARDKKERVAEAKKRLTELADKKRMADAHYKLSLIANIEGNDAEHERRVSLAAKTDPRHKEAMQEFRLQQRRKKGPQGTSPDKGGLFSKLRR